MWVAPLSRTLTTGTAMFTFLIASASISAATQSSLAPWSCPKPENIQSAPADPTVVAFDFTGTGQRFVRLIDGSELEVESPAPLVGCYAQRGPLGDLVNGWSLGAINRDADGYYWINAEGITWRLTLSSDRGYLTTATDAPYHSAGDRFVLLSDWPGRSGDCRAVNANAGNIRTGFPRSPVAIRASGIAKNLIVAVDFPDAPAQGTSSELVKQTMGPQLVTEFFAENSYGALTLSFDIYPEIVRSVRSSIEYRSDLNGNYFVNGQWQDQVLTRDIALQLQGHINFSEYESLSLLITGGAALSGYSAAAVPGIGIQTQSGTVRNSLFQGIGTGTVTDRPVPSWKVFAHELGHLFGFADLYIAGTGSSGRSPGPFDLMGNTIGSANEFLGWHRWLQGWLPDDSVICDATGKSTQSFSLNKLSARSGQRLYVSQLSRTRLLIAELRTNSKFDQVREEGVLFYLLDLSVPSGQGPVSLVHSLDDRKDSQSDDYIRYQLAPVSLGQRIEFEGRVFRVSSMTSEMAFVEVLTLDAYRQSVDTSKTTPRGPATSVTAVKRTKGKTTIRCVRGKLVRMVTALKPRCPAGFKRR